MTYNMIKKIKNKKNNHARIHRVARNFCGLAIFCILRKLIFAIGADCFFLAGNLFLRFSESTKYPALKYFRFC